MAALRRAVIAKLTYAVGKDPVVATERDWFVATALSVRDRIVDRWMTSTRATHAEQRKRVYYLSLEFLIGRLLIDALNNLQLLEPMRAALAELGVDLDRLREIEPDAALGNGGLGRLAACFMESMATLAIAAYGYGIRYNHGTVPPGASRTAGSANIRKPGCLWAIRGNSNGREVELHDRLRRLGGGDTGADGTTMRMSGSRPKPSRRWPTTPPMVGWRGRHVNTLRLWSARALDPLRLDTFNHGDHRRRACRARRAPTRSRRCCIRATTPRPGQELRLRQEYFFAAASLQDICSPPRPAVTAHPHAAANRPRSSSTTRIRPSPSPS